ncbi:MAG: MBL fold metallo-hydrolase [Anaerolineae bacterium]|nr:MBL fold metallo-hydrolase [Anaerolineae bacterium]
MLKLHLIQAEYGDCLILEHGDSSNPRYILIDGGPAPTYQVHLRPKLLEISAAGGKLDLVVLSHVDDDHIAGLLELLAELQRQHDQGQTETIAITALWHNTFSQTLGQEVEARFRLLMQNTPTPRETTTCSTSTERSIGQGDELTQSAEALRIPINPEFTPQGLICVDEAPQAIILGDLSLQVVGPTRQNLAMLQQKWLTWLEQQERRLRAGESALTARAAAKADESIPNLSSIMLLAEAEGQTILFTGDGRGDDLLQGLAQANLLDPGGKLHVNVLKLPHHGSRRNITRKFFQTITADKYVICANGKDDNPDLTTLQWMVQAARKGGRRIEILMTNPTASTRQLRQEYDPDVYGYCLVEMAPHAHALSVELVAPPGAERGVYRAPYKL